MEQDSQYGGHNMEEYPQHGHNLQEYPQNRHNMKEHPQHDLPNQSDESYPEEKPSHTQTSKTSKRYLFRIFRLGASLTLTITALVLTLIILIVGRHGDGASDLALITVDMSNFARFNPPTIQLVHNETEATKTRRGIGSLTSGIAGAASSVETFASGAASAAKTAASGVETAVATAVANAKDEADEIIKEIGDTIEDIGNAVEGLMDKVLDKIQDELNKWLHEAASSLDEMDIPNKMSLHLTTSCSSKSRNTTNSTETTCSKLFTSGETSFNTTNNGTLFGFQPGNIIAKALGVFFIPAGAQQAIKHPVDNAANTVQKLMQEAESEVSAWTVNVLFIPIVAVYVLATIVTSLLLLILIAATALAVKAEESVPARVYSVCSTMGAAATFLLFLGSVVLTVIALVVYIVGLGGNIIGISIAAGSRLKWISWAACIIMALVTISFKAEEYVAECVFWWNFLSKLLRLRKNKGGLREAMRGL